MKFIFATRYFKIIKAHLGILFLVLIDLLFCKLSFFCFLGSTLILGGVIFPPVQLHLDFGNVLQNVHIDAYIGRQFKGTIGENQIITYSL